MRTIRAYMVGGCVRDRILGVPSKDIDFSVEGARSFDEMREWIVSQGGEIFLETPEHLTIRARIGRGTFDYVMCRRDGAYGDGRRPDEVFPGTLYDDLSRRDFTMNAIALDPETNTYIDYFNGIEDIASRVIRCVGNPRDRFSEDALRLLRAARFSITKSMSVDPSISVFFDDEFFIQRMVDTISSERIEAELDKMFRFDTIRTMRFFASHPALMEACFSGRTWLKPTSRGK